MKHPTHSFRDVRDACHRWLREHDLLEPWELAMEAPEEETPEDKERRRRLWNKHPGRKLSPAPLRQQCRDQEGMVATVEEGTARKPVKRKCADPTQKQVQR